MERHFNKRFWKNCFELCFIEGLLGRGLQNGVNNQWTGRLLLEDRGTETKVKGDSNRKGQMGET